VGMSALLEGFRGFTVVAKDGIKIVERALESGFRSKGARAWIFAEKSDYKDFIRMYVISDFFRRKKEKDRLGEIFSMMEENGAKDAIPKISLCVPMTKRECDKEFGRGLLRGPFLSVGLQKTGRAMKSRPKVHRLAQVRATK
jgi:hypothetical protein